MIAIWTAHQSVKYEQAVDFPIPQENMSCKELGGHAEAL
jgi:hypothetical protein